MINGVMEQYLGRYVNYLQYHWVESLPILEFSGNNVDTETTSVSQFFTKNGYHPQIQLDLSSANGQEDCLSPYTRQDPGRATGHTETGNCIGPGISAGDSK